LKLEEVIGELLCESYVKTYGHHLRKRKEINIQLMFEKSKWMTTTWGRKAGI
jgi:hypothetical protein